MNGCRIPHFGLKKQYRNLKDELLDATDKVLSSGNLMNGEYTNRFESWLASRTKANFAITVHSGTQALEIMARYHTEPYTTMFDMTPKVKLPNLTYVATLNAFINAGWEVELLDTHNDGLVYEHSESLDDVVNSVCIVGLYGAQPPTDNLVYNNVIVDGAQHWLIADNIGDGMAISFDPTKNLPANGNGGAIVTNDRGLYEFAYSYRSNGKNQYMTFGTNSRMSEQDCAQILVKTQYIDKWQWRRKEIRYYYLDRFKALPINCLSRNHTIHSDQKFVIYTDQRDDLMNYLLDKGIDVKIHYTHALSELPMAHNLVKPDMLSVSVMMTRGLLSLPIYPELTDSEVEYVAEQVKKFYTIC